MYESKNAVYRSRNTFNNNLYYNVKALKIFTPALCAIFVMTLLRKYQKM